MASMIGIGVAVDYSLHRLRASRRDLHAGADSAQALARAMSISGTAVVFSGAKPSRCRSPRSLRSTSTRSVDGGGRHRVVFISCRLDQLLARDLAAVGMRHRPGCGGRSPADESRRQRSFWNGWVRRVMFGSVNRLAVGAASCSFSRFRSLDCRVHARAPKTSA